jgi:hypothetical protein
VAESALYIGWGEAARGREKRALDVFNEAMQYYGRLQKEGKIERFDVAALAPHGGDLGGFFLLRGTAQQIDSVRRDEEFERLISRVRLVVDDVGFADAFVDEKLAQVMAQYQEEIGKVG